MRLREPVRDQKRLHETQRDCKRDCKRLRETARDPERLQETQSDCKRPIVHETRRHCKRPRETARDQERLRETMLHISLLHHYDVISVQVI